MLFWSSLWQIRPNTNFPQVHYAFAIVITLFLIALAFYFFRRRLVKDSTWRKSTKGIAGTILSTAIIGLFLTWSRLEGIPYFAMRGLWLSIPLILSIKGVLVFLKHRALIQKKEYFAKKVHQTTSNHKYLPKAKKAKK
ncbi:MAG TPA: hypothetical protein PLQ36_02680 [Candidatus Gracilibacteria bacterium]|nr:hypothetical protein [Candidatus Gracilibacteria bacterium]